MDDAAGSPAELTIDDLARQAQLPVRTLREYQSMRLLPAPERRGRIGVYSGRHVQRLELIARLQRRGYSLAGIKDLLGAWDRGTDLTTVLGIPAGPAALDEAPLRVTRAELLERLPAVTPAILEQAAGAGLVSQLDDEYLLVRSPALLGFAVDGAAAGVPMAVMLDIIGALIGDVGGLAQNFADMLVAKIWEPAAHAGKVSELEAMLQRGRGLLLQGVASILADRLGAALLARAGHTPSGEALRDALGRIRVGITSDAEGTIQRRTPRKETAGPD
jgi:DNA-binding transcriptional MerR regulator